jgi:hypothetical protein
MIKKLLLTLLLPFSLYSVDVDMEFDPYYSNVGLFFPLTDEEVPTIEGASELDIYKRLLLGSYIPQFFYTEFSINPMPNAGVFIRRNAPEFYQDSTVTITRGADINRINLTQSITAGFEEPYAFSFFFGNAMRFKEPGQDANVNNKGFMGFLLNIGDYHIKDNRMIYDKWFELEWKIKTDRAVSNQTLSLSYRIGLKIHDHPDIEDTYYLSARRSRLDVGVLDESFYHNSGFEYRVDFSTQTNEAIRHYFLLDKKFPVTDDKKAFSLGLGFISQSSSKYTGLLANDKLADAFQILIRPNLSF